MTQLPPLPRGNSFESFDLLVPEPVEDSAPSVSTLNTSFSSFSSMDGSLNATERRQIMRRSNRRCRSSNTNRWESVKAVEACRRRQSNESMPVIPRRKHSAPNLLGLENSVSEESLVHHAPIHVTASLARSESAGSDNPVPPRRKESSNDLLGMSMDEEDSEEEEEVFDFQSFLYQPKEEGIQNSHPQEMGNATRAALLAATTSSQQQLSAPKCRTRKDRAPSTPIHTLSPPPPSGKVLPSSVNTSKRWAFPLSPLKRGSN